MARPTWKGLLARGRHRLAFHLWLLGATDVEGFERRVWILGRVRRKLLHGPHAARLQGGFL